MSYNGGYNTYPEAMEPIESGDVRRALRILEGYIKYVCERSDFAIGGIRQLPKVTAKDAGKILIVNSEGEWEAVSPDEI